MKRESRGPDIRVSDIACIPESTGISMLMPTVRHTSMAMMHIVMRARIVTRARIDMNTISTTASARLMRTRPA